MKIKYITKLIAFMLTLISINVLAANPFSKITKGSSEQITPQRKFTTA